MYPQLMDMYMSKFRFPPDLVIFPSIWGSTQPLDLGAALNY